MNTYRDNLRTSVIDSLATMEDELTKQENNNYIAAHNYYYSKSSELTAIKKSTYAVKYYDKTFKVSEQGAACGDSAKNMMLTAEGVATEVNDLITNTATAAKNVQVAANAISKLAASIGSANSFAYASLYDSDVQQDISHTNELINKVAYKAENIAYNAMKFSKDAAQIIAPRVFHETTRTLNRFDEMQQKTQADLAKLSQDRATATDKQAEATTQLIVDEGKLTAKGTILDATKNSYNTSISNLNYNFKVKAIVGDKNLVNVSCNEFKSMEQEDSPPKNNNVDLLHKYYVFAVNADLVKGFTFEQADTAFKKHGDGLCFVQLSNKSEDCLHKYKNTCECEEEKGCPHFICDIDLINDIDNKPIEKGKPYVLYLYIKLNGRYKRKVNNFSDILSAPSREFVLNKKLPEFNDMKCILDKSTENKCYFEIENNCNEINSFDINVLSSDNTLCIKYNEYKSNTDGASISTTVVFRKLGEANKESLNKSDVEGILLEQESKGYKDDDVYLLINIEDINKKENIDLVNKLLYQKDIECQCEVYFHVRTDTLATDGVILDSQLSSPSNAFSLTNELKKIDRSTKKSIGDEYYCMLVPKGSVNNDVYHRTFVENQDDSLLQGMKDIATSTNNKVEATPEKNDIGFLTFDTFPLKLSVTIELNTSACLDIFGRLISTPTPTPTSDLYDFLKCEYYFKLLAMVHPESQVYKTTLSSLTLISKDDGCGDGENQNIDSSPQLGCDQPSENGHEGELDL